MDDLRLGRLIRILRIRKGWRQEDLARRAGVSRATVSRLERGALDDMPARTFRQVCEPLEIRVELVPRGRGADLDRLVNARHGALHESVARMLASTFPGWEMAHEVSFNIWGERGVIDLLLWHPGRRALLIIELKTELVDAGDLLATMDRRRRLAAQIVRDRGWVPSTISRWVVVARSRTNERRLAEHRTVLRSAFPDGASRVRAWLADPIGQVSAISLLRADGGHEIAPTLRVRQVHRGEVAER